MRVKAFWIAVFLAFMLGVGPPTVEAATNRVMGGVGGINNGTITGGDGTGASAITINSVNLALVKQAWDMTGNVLADGSDVTSNNEIYFVLYVDNPTDAPAANIQIRDQIDEAQFTYIDGSLETTNVASGSNDATIWAGPWSGLNDSNDADIGSVLDTAPTDGNRDLLTIGAEPTQSNPQLDISARTLQAIRFRVRVN
jgi:hypothetical protein